MSYKLCAELKTRIVWCVCVVCLLICYEGPVAEDLVESAMLHYRVFWQLKEHFDQEDEVKLFMLTAKGHQNVHACLASTSLSPRMSWCFGGEDYMGKMRILASAASKGTGGLGVSRKMLQRYRVALHFTMSDPNTWFWRR